MHLFANAKRTLLVLCLGAIFAAPAVAKVENNPGYDRPGLGFTPAVLHRGAFTLEQGLPDWRRTGGTSTYNAGTLLRLGVGHALELQLGTGWNWVEGSGSTLDGRANTSLALKYAPASAGEFTWGLLGNVELNDGAQAFRGQYLQYLLGASVNWQKSTDLALGFYIEAEAGDGDSQLLALNGGWGLTPALGMFVELAAQHSNGAGYAGMGGGGATWQATPRLQIDIGLRRRVAGFADTWQGGLGFAVYFGD